MRSTTLLAATLLGNTAFAAPNGSKQEYAQYMKGFKNPTVSTSEGGHAICINGIVEVDASADNVKIDIHRPINQIELTELL
jgi:hypothetical protein